MSEQQTIYKYNFAKQFRRHGTFAVIARRGSGKSVLLLDILYRIRKRFDFGIAFTTTTPTANALAEHMPRACIFMEFSVDKLKVILDEQEMLISKGKSREIFVLLDDCGFDGKSMNSKVMRELFMNGRHKAITFLCALQYPNALRPDLRQQLDTVVALKENVIPNRKRIHDAFFGCLTWHNFERMFSAFTENFGAIVIDQTVQSSEVSKVIFHYRAETTLPPFICVNRAYLKIWEMVKKSEEEVMRLRETQIEQERKRRMITAAKESGATPMHVAVRDESEGGRRDGMVVQSLY